MPRGGAQRIPRPEHARPGDRAPWAGLGPAARRFGLDDVRAVCAAMGPARLPVALEHARPAAVLVAIFEEDGEARIILTKRPETMPSHRGEIAFPGGKFEPGLDADLRATALREAHEEIGLGPDGVEIVAELDHLYTAAGAFLLAPYVGLLPARPELTPHPTEVVSVFDVGVSELLDEEAYREERWDRPDDGGTRPIHFFELWGETVWGATARILTGFLERLTAVR